jgi:hypothetical protein
MNNDKEIIVDNKGCGGTGCADKKGGKCCDNGGACPIKAKADGISELTQWPIKLSLLDPASSEFKEADIVIAADCAPFAYANFHERFLAGRKLIIFCPQSEAEQKSAIAKLTKIFQTQNIHTVTLLRLEVSCCDGLEDVVAQAIEQSGVNVLIKEFTISTAGKIV